MFKLFFIPAHTEHTGKHINTHKTPLSIPHSGRQERQRCLCASLCQACLLHYFKHDPKMNTQAAALHHPSSSQPPGMCGSTVEQHVVVRLHKTTVFLQFITRFPGNQNNNNQGLVFDLNYRFDRFPFSPSSLLMFVFFASPPPVSTTSP